MKTEYSQDDVIDAALVEFGRVLKNRHALMRQIAQDWSLRNPPIEPAAFDHAGELVMMAFRQLCIAAEWVPDTPKRPNKNEALAEEYYYQDLLRMMPTEEYRRLVLGEWTPPEDTGGAT